jgi:hypothetical protein
MPKPKVKHVKFTAAEMAYDLPEELDFSKLIPIVGRGIHAAEGRGERPLKATYAVVDDAQVSFTLDDGRKVSAPLVWYPRLVHATPGERNDWRLLSGGRIVLWQSLGIGIAVKAIFEGEKANESPASLKKWLLARRATERTRRAG